jgi:hypothetical protein
MFARHGRQLLFAMLVLALSNTALPHSGGLNAEGCHTNRKTGDYHCHRAARKPAEIAAPKSGGISPVFYRNCSEARAAGVAPIRRGQPGYGTHLDRDNDGIACEQ